MKFELECSYGSGIVLVWCRIVAWDKGKKFTFDIESPH